MTTENLKYLYKWPQENLSESPEWRKEGSFFVRDMPESKEALASDSRWPAIFPSPISLVTSSDGQNCALEKVVGATVINRFPYIIALSFCKDKISDRHHPRQCFMNTLEKSGKAAVQFIAPGAKLDKAMNSILTIPENDTFSRIENSGLETVKAQNSEALVFKDAYMVYEASLVKPGKDFNGQEIHKTPWVDIGSHRVYMMEINCIQLKDDIAEGRSQILWQSLPGWGEPNEKLKQEEQDTSSRPQYNGYMKGFKSSYAFPTPGTTAFEKDFSREDMAVRNLAPLPEDQVEVDNDRARWPCFFPSFVSMITSWDAQGRPNVMPCGSTAVLSRHPFVIAPCISYAKINERYAPRVTLESIKQTGKFGCSISFDNNMFIEALRYSGNLSIANDPEKFKNSGLECASDDWAPYIPAVPVHYDCEVIDEIILGTHIMFVGKVVKIRVRDDVTTENPLKWYPWADVIKAGGAE